MYRQITRSCKPWAWPVLLVAPLIAGCCNPCADGLMLSADCSLQLDQIGSDACFDGMCDYGDGSYGCDDGTVIESTHERPTPAVNIEEDAPAEVAPPYPRFHPVPTRPVFSRTPAPLMAYYPVYGRTARSRIFYSNTPQQGYCASGACGRPAVQYMPVQAPGQFMPAQSPGAVTVPSASEPSPTNVSRAENPVRAASSESPTPTPAPLRPGDGWSSSD